MSSYIKYITIFNTTLVKTAPSKIIADPVKIEFFNGPKSYRVSVQMASILPKGMKSNVAKDTKLNLPGDSQYIAITARTKEAGPRIVIKFCEDHIDQMITKLSLIYSSGLFAKEIYRGFQIDGTRIIFNTWLKFQDPFDVYEKKIKEKLKIINKAQSLDQETKVRFKLMARFFRKALLSPPCEEKLLYLWTILEIFPMKDTSNIKPIGQYLSKRLGRNAEIVKEKLGIGKLFGIRSDLVHDGFLNIEKTEMGEVFRKLETICVEVLKEMCGIDYENTLEEYFV